MVFSNYYPKLLVNLKAIQNNYKLISDKLVNSRSGAAVKADAYGLGAERVAQALTNIGCKDFFLANLDEAISIRKTLPSEVNIYNLNGCFPKELPYFHEFNIIPVINHRDQLEWWSNQPSVPICAVHVDTGINRLGLSFEEFLDLYNTKQDLLKKSNINYIFSHLASGDDISNDYNKLQLKKVRHIRTLFPDIQLSFANSAGIFLGRDYHFDLTRAGLALYGMNPYQDINPMQQVVTLTAPVIQIKKLDTAQYVGYSNTYLAPAGTILAVICIGYADGLPLNYSNIGKAVIAGQKVNIVGRISMDLTVIDVTNCPGAELGTEVELLNEEITIDEMSSVCKTLGYEILTGFNKRIQRIYI